ncbi:MAG: putative membrane protein insertion efficiency factor [Chlamydiales bacterium]|nr:putative membrane protein insertion efficiency factor [Chlamydiales bacterium]
MKIICLVLTLSLLNNVLYSASYCENENDPWGADATLVYKKRKNTAIQKPQLTKGQKSCRAMIRFFQVYISPIDGPRSSFYPTSSQYALEAIQKHGVFQGIAMGCDRLMRENGEFWVYERTGDYGIDRKVDPVR